MAAVDVASGLRAQLESGLTLPASWYSDPAVLALEQERIFKRSWQYVGVAADVAEPGQFVTCRAGDVPVVVVRGRDLELRAFVNVCRHRGSRLCESHDTTFPQPLPATTVRWSRTNPRPASGGPD